MLQITLFFTCVRISFGRSTTRLLNVKFIHVLLFRKSTKRCDTSYLSCLLLEPKCSCITFRELTNDTVLFTIYNYNFIYNLSKEHQKKIKYTFIKYIIKPIIQIIERLVIGEKNFDTLLGPNSFNIFQKGILYKEKYIFNIDLSGRISNKNFIKYNLKLTLGPMFESLHFRM